ncbi:MAG: hypothetical protein K2H60_12395 [Muribaculaceae bacterium]|nr:hypothetical protein [Muribaculaceae bacterium]
MEYKLPWGSTHPGLLVYLVDLSGSMAWDDKIKRVSNIIWNVLDCLIAPCQDMGVYKERFHLEIVGYNQYTYELFSGGVNKVLDAIDATESNQQFIDIEKEGKAQGLTHMAMAYEKAAEIIRKWIKEQTAKNIPIPAPVVINITDGYPEEVGVPEADSRNKALRAARELLNISVPDGRVLLFNIHIDGEAGSEPELMFPDSRPTDNKKGFLFDASTELNDIFVTRAQRAGLPAKPNSHFMVSNLTDAGLLTKLIVFGSSVSGLTKPNGRCEVPIP